MTLEQMLTLTDASVKNEQSEEVKISWIREVEGRILFLLFHEIAQNR